jgi:hypothetical protein
MPTPTLDLSSIAEVAISEVSAQEAALPKKRRGLPSAELSDRGPAGDFRRASIWTTPRNFTARCCAAHASNTALPLNIGPLRSRTWVVISSAYLGTLMRALHELPGATFSRPAQRGQYDSEATAVMTLVKSSVGSRNTSWVAQCERSQWAARALAAPAVVAGAVDELALNRTVPAGLSRTASQYGEMLAKWKRLNLTAGVTSE